MSEQEYPRQVYHKVQFWAELLAGMTISLAVVLLIGGPERTSARAYELVNNSGPLVWGLSFFIVGITTVVCCRWNHNALKWALRAQAIPYAALAISFTVTAVRYPEANLTAAPIYSWLVIIHLFLADFASKEYR